MSAARDAIQPGDTVVWTARNGTRSWGIADWADSGGVHVSTGSRTRRGFAYRHLVKWAAVTGHYPGRAEYDRHA